MMKIDVQNLCEDLDKLLKDICEFLSDEVNNKNLTEKQRLFANKLIERSKKQLQQLSTVLSVQEGDDAYVDMSPHTVTNTDSTPIEVEPINCPSTFVTKDETCPYEDLPAMKLVECEKFGVLDRKGKILFIEHHKKLFVGVKNNWLLIYGSKKDNKPIECLNLSLFLAKALDAPKPKTFELTCIRTRKTFQFVALTPKDMMQWLACINKNTFNSGSVHNVIPVDEYEVNTYEPVKQDEENKTNKRKNISIPLPPLPPMNVRTTPDVPPKLPHNKNQIDEGDPTYSELDDFRIEMKIAKFKPRRSPKLNEIKTESQELTSCEEIDPVYDLPEKSTNITLVTETQKSKIMKNYYNTNNIPCSQSCKDSSTPPPTPQMDDSFSDSIDHTYDLIQNPMLQERTNNLNSSNKNPQLNAIERGSQLTISSFSDIDEDQTYDLPVRPSDKSLSKRLDQLQISLKEALTKQNCDKSEEETKSDDNLEYDYLCPQSVAPLPNKRIIQPIGNLKELTEKLQPAPPPKPKMKRK